MGRNAMTNDTPALREDLVEKVAPLVAQVVELQNLAVRGYESVVEQLIRSGSQDAEEIEAVLDRLLDVACVPDGLKLFKALCRHYYFIDPVSTADYVQTYRTLWDDDAQDME
jgi:hypothetical protein